MFNSAGTVGQPHAYTSVGLGSSTITKTYFYSTILYLTDDGVGALCMTFSTVYYVCREQTHKNVTFKTFAGKNKLNYYCRFTICFRN